MDIMTVKRYVTAEVIKIAAVFLYDTDGGGYSIRNKKQQQIVSV